MAQEWGRLHRYATPKATDGALGEVPSIIIHTLAGNAEAITMRRQTLQTHYRPLTACFTASFHPEFLYPQMKSPNLAD